MPTPNVSVVDLVIQTEKKTFAEEARPPATELIFNQNLMFGVSPGWVGDLG